MSRFCLALRLTLDSSLSIDKAVRMSLLATGNAAFMAQADRIAKRVNKGDEVAEAIGINPIFPAEFLATLNVGEVERTNPEVMARQAEFYREERPGGRRRSAGRWPGRRFPLVGIFIIVAIFRMAFVYVRALGG